MARNKPTEILITNRTIEYGGVMHILHAVNRVFMGKGKIKRPFGMKTLFWTVVVVAVFVALANNPGSQNLGIAGAVLSASFFLFTLYKDLQPRTVWALVFEENSQKTNVIFTRDRATVQEAINRIREALHSNSAFQQTIHFNSGQIVNADRIDGDINYNP